MSHGDPDNWWTCSECGAMEGQKPGDRMEGWALGPRLLCPNCAPKPLPAGLPTHDEDAAQREEGGS